MATLQDSNKIVSFSVDTINLLNKGKEQKLNYHVLNCSAVSKKLRVSVSKSSNKSFTLSTAKDERVLASGLRLPVLLHYSPCDVDTSHYGAVEVYVDDQLQLSIPIKSVPPSPNISCTPPIIDFNNVPHYHQTISKLLTIYNTGTSEGTVRIDGSQLSSFITLSATNGTVKPNEKLEINIKLLCREVTAFQDKIRIFVNGIMEHEVSVMGQVVPAKLQLLTHSGQEELKILHLGLTYYGSTVKEVFTIRNDSPSTANFIATLSTQSNGYEQGVDMDGELSLACTTGGLHYGSWKEQGDAPLPSKMISITPSEGLLEPHESRLVELNFTPSFIVSEKGWSHHQGLKSRRDYALFVNFNAVGENLDKDILNERGVELGVTVAVIPVDISTIPAKSLVFGKCVTGLVQSKKLKLINNCDQLSAPFQLRLPAHYKVSPMKGVIKPGESVSMDIIFQPKQFGVLNGQLCIDIFQDEQSTVIVHTHAVTVHGVGTSNHISKRQKKKKILAAADDLSCSVRPHDKRYEVITPFTKVKRHTYTDCDYAFTDEEAGARQTHRSYYENYINEQKRKRNKETMERKLGKSTKLSDVDIGIQPGAGIVPSNLSLEKGEGHNEEDPNPDTILTDIDYTMHHMKELTRIDSPITKHCSVRMVDDCQLTLTPNELRMITLDPPSIKKVGGDSVIRGNKLLQEIQIKNYSTLNLMCTIKVDSPLSIVSRSNKRISSWRFILSPRSFTPVTVEFSSEKCGEYHQSVECLINKHQSFQVPISVSVIDVAVIPSSTHVTLTQFPLSTHNNQLQGSVTLHNPHNVSVHYSWDFLQHGDYLMISNSEGVIPAMSFISCHFLYTEDYQQVKEFVVIVNIDRGQPLEITLQPKYLKSDCHFKESVLFFNPASLYLPCRKNITCINKGRNHAYYKVLGCHPPIQGVKVTPMTGCIPAGGQIELSFQLTATELGSFESWFKLKLKEGKTINIRITGSVELPRVYIDKDQFVFGNVFCGSSASIPFTLYNQGLCQVFLTFNFTSLSAFKVTLPDNTDPYRGEGDLCTSSTNDGIYQVVMPANSSINCTLHFTPKDIASYDFITPILINGQDPVAPPLSSWPPSSDDPHVSINRRLPSLMDTPKRRVIATTVLAPLHVGNRSLTFKPSSTNSTSLLNKQSIELVNVSDSPVTWSIGSNDGDNKRLRDGTFKFFLESKEMFQPPLWGTSSGDVGNIMPKEKFTFYATFSPPHHGVYSTTLPLYINGDHTHPYRQLSLSAELIPDRIVSYPSHVAVQPVPLGVTVEAQFTVVLKGFSGSIVLEASTPDDYPDGVQISVNLPEKFEKSKHKDGGAELTCELTFCSSIPISVTDSITFQEKNSGKMKKIPFTVCSDNSLLTVYEFISDNINSVKFQHDGEDGQPVLHLPTQPYTCRSKSSLSYSPTSSSTSFMTPFTVSSLSMSYGELFLTDCKGYICRYLSLFGSNNGLHNIRNPTEFIQCVGKGYSEEGGTTVRALGTSRGPLLDLIRHLCGRLPPGISQTPAPSRTRIERVQRHFDEINTTLTFLKSQGALLWVVVPESLFDWRDFVYWRERNSSMTTPSLLININKEEFQDTSERSWTHLLAQIIKVLVLPKLLCDIPKDLKSILTIDRQTSNVYSYYEILLLEWMNKLHTDDRQSGHSEISSFDVDLMDCNVLSSVIHTYAPYLTDDNFNGLYKDATTPEQVHHNAQLLVNACRQLNLNYDIQPSDLSAPHPIGLLLFTAYLFYCLPSYTPNTTIRMEGETGNKTMQKLKVSNPSARVLEYHSLIIGQNKDCFSTSDNIVVPPNSSVYMDIVFNVKRINTCSAVLLLLSVTGKGRPGKTVAFALIGEPTLVKPMMVKSVECCLYDTVSIPVKCTNLYDGCSEFEISLTEGMGLQQAITKKKNTPKEKKFHNNSVTIATSTLRLRSTDSMNLFHINEGRVSLKKGESMDILLEFVPMKMHHRQCCIVLSSESLGDMVMMVNAVVNTPPPTHPVINHCVPSAHINESTRTVHLKSSVGEIVKEELVIGNKNKAFEEAIIELGKWEINPKERERRINTNSLWYASLQRALTPLRLDEGANSHWGASQGSSDLHFMITTDSDLFKVPDTLSLPAVRNGSCVLPIEFTCNNEGRYSCNINLKSPHDVRVYRVEAMVMDKGRSADIEIVSPALECVTQKIPLTNPTTIDWPLSVELTGKGFSGPSELMVKALTTGYYPLMFWPRKECTCQGSLRLLNTNDDTEHCFNLRGIAEKPQAEDNITIQTKAKASILHTLHIRNTNDRTTTYTVECDLDFVSGPPTVTVAGGDVADYPVLLEPLQRGVYTGCIVFVAENKSGIIKKSSVEHLWYELNVTVDPSDPIDSRFIEGNALSSTEHTIVVTNPFDCPVTLQVSLEGSGLSGSQELYIDGHDRALYTVLYTPTMIGKDKGCVLFTGREDGEIMIELELVARDPVPVTLGTAQCELGKSVYGSLSLSNSLDHDVKFTYITENDHFNVVGLVDGEITVPAHSSSDVSIMFKPTNIGSGHSTSLIFTSHEFGRQEFLMDGIGLSPSPQDATIISCLINANSMAIISFTNPLAHSASFDINLKMNHDVFCLFLKQSKSVLLQSGVSLDIPIMYAPDSMKMAYTELIITTNEGAALTWVYPIHGQPEKIPSTRNTQTTIKGKAKERVETIIDVYMTVLKNDEGDEHGDEELSILDRYQYELISTDSDHLTHLKEYTGIQLLTDTDSNGEVQLSFNIVFLPSKPINFKAELHVQPLGNGVWRYPLSFEAVDQSPDDTIILKAKHLTKETKKCFHLTSLSDEPIPFNASLYPPTHELIVTPSIGLLLPKGSEGTKFTITYKPKSFNKSIKHVLKVETDTTQWSYEVIGEPSMYQSPAKHSIARVDHRIRLEMMNHQNKRNFLRHNIELLND